MNKYLLEHTFDIIQGEITTLIPLSGLHVWLLRDTQDYLFNTEQKALKEKKKVVVIFSFYSKLTGTNKKKKIKTFRHRKLWSLVKPQFLLMRFSYKLLKVSAGWKFNCPTTPTVCNIIGWGLTLTAAMKACQATEGEKDTYEVELRVTSFHSLYT